jgi:hypothetical protein
MDSERRHELEENDLAGTTTQLVDRIRPHLRTIVTAIGAVFAGLAAWTLIASQQEAAKAQSWETCLAAISSGDGKALGDVLRRFPGTPAASWAQLVLADSTLSQGCNLLFTDRAQALERLENAAARYQQLIATRPTGMLAERAVFGLAKANESLGRLDDARKGYEAVVADHPAGASAGLAAARVTALSREGTRQWYDWFSTQKFTPPTPPASDAVTPESGAATAPQNAAPDAGSGNTTEPAGTPAGQ